jgi:hypothetical protein
LNGWKRGLALKRNKKRKSGGKRKKKEGIGGGLHSDVPFVVFR